MPEHLKKIQAAVIGANGYTGVELIRLLLAHPHVELTAITSRSHAGKKLASVFPSFRGKTAIKFSPPNVRNIGTMSQVVFLCLPHRESMDMAKKFRELGCKVIDLSADFRFKSLKTYEKTYGEHSQKGLAKQSVYGLCEIFGEDIKSADLVGVPGCYVTSVILALAPLLQNQMIVTNNIICDCKSGTSGAGRSAKVEQLFAEVFDNFKAYGIADHRHRPEIEEKLSMLAGKDVTITFTPHLLPLSRGILSTIYVKPIRKLKNGRVLQLYHKFYKRSPFVSILPDGESPQVKAVIGTNQCHISAHYDAHSEQLIIISALDNLLKGASGQAVQCLNLMSGFEETAGLTQVGIYP